MKQQGDIYELLGVTSTADLPEIIQAYRQRMGALKAEAASLDKAVLEARLAALRDAFSILSDPKRRADYDRAHSAAAVVPDELDMLLAEAAMPKPRRSPLRNILTIIAVLLMAGLTIQVSVMFMAYRQARSLNGGEGGMPPAAQKTADRVVLMELNQTYGFNAKTREEAEAKAAEIEAREKQERAACREEEARERQLHEEKRFTEDARREAEYISADLRAAEQRLVAEQEESKRRAEMEEQQRQDAIREKLERDTARWRNRRLGE